MTVVLWSAAPAAADEFPAVVVVPTSGAGAVAGADAFAGFRLAVDASPDVSHPPGTEGGDHLGGSDVDLTVIDAGQTPAATAVAVRERVDAGTGIVVVLAAPPGVLEAVQEAVREDEVVIIVAPDSEGATDVRTVALLDRGADAGSGVAFDSAFAAAHGRPPSSAAAAGYDAGIAIDAAVAALGTEVRDARSVSGALVGTDRFARSAVVGPAASAVAPPTARERSVGLDEDDGGPGTGLVVAGAAGVAMALAAAAAVRTRGSGRSDDRESPAPDEDRNP